MELFFKASFGISGLYLLVNFLFFIIHLVTKEERFDIFRKNLSRDMRKKFLTFKELQTHFNKEFDEMKYGFIRNIIFVVSVIIVMYILYFILA